MSATNCGCRTLAATSRLEKGLCPALAQSRRFSHFARAMKMCQISRFVMFDHCTVQDKLVACCLCRVGILGDVCFWAGRTEVGSEWESMTRYLVLRGR